MVQEDYRLTVYAFGNLRIIDILFYVFFCEVDSLVVRITECAEDTEDAE